MTKKSKTKKKTIKETKPPEVQVIKAEHPLARQTRLELSRIRKLWLSQRTKITREQGKVLLEQGRLRGLQLKLAKAKLKEIEDGKPTNQSQKTT